MINLNFLGRRIWAASVDRDTDIFVVARPHEVPAIPYGDSTHYPVRIEVYARRPGMGLGPTLLIGHNGHPAGSP